ncbi:MAG: hypothetical protein A2577_08925 [Bdellovibrionales bacterium RIFOXYD1_FULL_36_51]|nr:MAG: hypothetical protein A2577_08925 [Bdellovibrionales bacterium RIFOXYD1_FULL_36_51]
MFEVGNSVKKLYFIINLITFILALIIYFSTKQNDTFINLPFFNEAVTYPSSWIIANLPISVVIRSILSLFIQVNILLLSYIIIRKNGLLICYLLIWISYFFSTVPTNNIYTEFILKKRIITYRILSFPVGTFYNPEINDYSTVNERLLILCYLSMGIIGIVSMILSTKLIKKKYINKWNVY